MISLRKKYWGAQDEYLWKDKIEPMTIESTYSDTVKKIIVWDSGTAQDVVPKAVRARYEYINEMIHKNPTEYAEEYTQMKNEYKEKGIWNIVSISKEPKKRSNRHRVLLDRGRGLGFTGVRFVGNPFAVESISLEIGGQRFDKIYPFITGRFDSMPLLDTVIPYPAFHEICFVVEFCEKDQPLEIYYDQVDIKNEDYKQTYEKSYDTIFVSTQYNGNEEVSAGLGSIKLNYNHPILRMVFFTDEPLTKPQIILDNDHKLHVPYKGIQGKKHVYEVGFNTTINFSRVNSSSFDFETSTKNTIYPFAICYNIARFMSGMAGLAFSK
jgi:hypothetical protein